MKKKIIKFIIVLIILLLSFSYTIKWLDKIDLDLDRETLELLLENTGNIKSENRIITKVVNVIRDTDLIDPVSLVLNNYDTKPLINEEQVEETFEIKNDPIIYIYNTHQTEKYLSFKEINLNYTVLDASYFLQKELKKYDIESVVEDASIMDVLRTNNWSYAGSYKVSRMFLEKRKKEHPSLKYYIDLHRDSVDKKISTTTINGKDYARTMFLIGLENENNKLNENVVSKLEDWLNKNYPGLSRGIYRKKGPGVNGVYNQDFSSLCILIEVGGEYNTFIEVENTIEVISEMLNYYIRSNND